jgi:hypothetical protein
MGAYGARALRRSQIPHAQRNRRSHFRRIASQAVLAQVNHRRCFQYSIVYMTGKLTHLPSH